MTEPHAVINTGDAAATEAVLHLIRQASAGSRLFYALYHHPNAVDVLHQACESGGFTNAYMAATEVFIPRGQQWPKGDVHFNPRPDEEDDAPLDTKTAPCAGPKGADTGGA